MKQAMKQAMKQVDTITRRPKTPKAAPKYDWSFIDALGVTV